jgi:nucleoside 2-deoxyribosyltransferase
MKIYLIGSLRNPRVPVVGDIIRKDLSIEVFDDWYAGGYEADDKWKEYEEARGRSYQEALYAENARHIFEFDKDHLDSSDCAVLVSPAGRSGHLELGYMIGKGKPSFIFLDKDLDRWDVMYRFADKVCFDFAELFDELEKVRDGIKR